MFVTRGDRMMPSAALVAARFAAKHGRGTYGENLFANAVVDTSKRETKNIVVYFDPDDNGRDGGAARLLAKSPTWFVDKLIVSASGGDSAVANGLLRSHINFLCSIRREHAFCEEDGIWYTFLHFAMIGRPRRPGRTTAGMDLYEATLRLVWRPMSAADPDYAAVTGIAIGD